MGPCQTRDERPADGRRLRRRGGIAQVVTLVALVAVAGMAAFGIDHGFMLSTHAQLQNAVDAAALAALGEVQATGSINAGRSKAIEIAQAHRAGGDLVQLDAGADVEFGGYDFDAGSFVPGAFTGLTAVRVTARRTDAAPGGPLSLFLAPVMGRSTAQVSASSVAAIGRRDVVLAQDVTLSFREEIGAVGDSETPGTARFALASFANAMADQTLSGDSLGLVTFNDAARVEQPLSPIPDQLGPVLQAIDLFDYCRNVGQADCAGTDIAPAIREAIGLFETEDEAERVILLVTDGVPCLPNDPGETAAREADALAAVEEAADADVSIFTVFLDNPTPLGGGLPPVYCGDVSSGTFMDIGDPGFAQQLVSGFGSYYETPDVDFLDDILVSILREMPLRVVR